MKKKMYGVLLAAFVLTTGMMFPLTVFSAPGPVFEGKPELPGTAVRFLAAGEALPSLQTARANGYRNVKQEAKKPAVTDTDILAMWWRRSWADTKIVAYEFLKGNKWLGYTPSVYGSAGQGSRYKGVVPVMEGTYKVLRPEGQHEPVFLMIDAAGKKYASVVIGLDEETDEWGISLNGGGMEFYKD